MFRKLVSNLSFSPALITQVSFYAKRLRQEEVTRRMTVVFVVLAVVVQSLAVFSPPESANASSEQDLIRGGVHDMTDLLARYDRNSDDIRDIYDTAGITRADLETAKLMTINSKDDIYSITRYAQYSADQGEYAFAYKRSAGGDGIRFVSPLALSDTQGAKKSNGTNYQAWVGSSTQLGWFAIMKSNASVATKGKPVTIVPTVDSSQALLRSLQVSNVTNDGATTAKPFDKLSYSLEIKNNSSSTATAPLSLRLTDVLEYSTLVDAGGGVYDAQTKTLSWPDVTMKPGVSEQRTVVVQLMGTLPSTANGASDGNSYDCVLSASYGTTTRVPVDCPALKGLEGVLGELPTGGIIANVVFSSTLLAVVVFFYTRTRQLKKEIRMIRHSLNTGTI